jgi:hypothetical protein
MESAVRIDLSPIADNPNTLGVEQMNIDKRFPMKGVVITGASRALALHFGRLNKCFCA